MKECADASRCFAIRDEVPSTTPLETRVNETNLEPQCKVKMFHNVFIKGYLPKKIADLLPASATVLDKQLKELQEYMNTAEDAYEECINCAYADLSQGLETTEVLLNPGLMITADSVVDGVLKVFEAPHDTSTIIGVFAQMCADIPFLAQVRNAIVKNQTALKEFGLKYRSQMEELEMHMINLFCCANGWCVAMLALAQPDTMFQGLALFTTA